jgi:hypothetical protein
MELLEHASSNLKAVAEYEERPGGRSSLEVVPRG